MPGFDYKGAKEAGISDKDIAEVLKSNGINYDLLGAKEYGISDDEIHSFLNSDVKKKVSTPDSGMDSQNGGAQSNLATQRTPITPTPQKPLQSEKVVNENDFNHITDPNDKKLAIAEAKKNAASENFYGYGTTGNAGTDKINKFVTDAASLGNVVLQSIGLGSDKFYKKQIDLNIAEKKLNDQKNAVKETREIVPQIEKMTGKSILKMNPDEYSRAHEKIIAKGTSDEEFTPGIDQVNYQRGLKKQKPLTQDEYNAEYIVNGGKRSKATDGTSQYLNVKSDNIEYFGLLDRRAAYFTNLIGEEKIKKLETISNTLDAQSKELEALKKEIDGASDAEAKKAYETAVSEFNAMNEEFKKNPTSKEMHQELLDRQAEVNKMGADIANSVASQKSSAYNAIWQEYDKNYNEYKAITSDPNFVQLAEISNRKQQIKDDVGIYDQAFFDKQRSKIDKWTSAIKKSQQGDVREIAGLKQGAINFLNAFRELDPQETQGAQEKNERGFADQTGNSGMKAIYKMASGIMKTPYQTSVVLGVDHASMLSEWLFNKAGALDVMNTALDVESSKRQRNISQQYVDFKGYKLLIGEDGTPTSVREKDFSSIFFPDGGQGIMNDYQETTKKTPIPIKRDFDGRTLFNQSMDVGTDMAAMILSGRGAVKLMGKAGGAMGAWGEFMPISAEVKNTIGTGFMMYAQAYGDFHKSIADDPNYTITQKHRFSSGNATLMSMVNLYFGDFEQSLVSGKGPGSLFSSLNAASSKILSGEATALQVFAEWGKRTGKSLAAGITEEEFQELFAEKLTAMTMDKHFSSPEYGGYINTMEGKEDIRNTAIATFVSTAPMTLISSPFTRSKLIDGTIEDILKKTKDKKYEKVEDYYKDFGKDFTRTKASDNLIASVKVAEEYGHEGDFGLIQQLWAGKEIAAKMEAEKDETIKAKLKKDLSQISANVNAIMNGTMKVKDAYERDEDGNIVYETKDNGEFNKAIVKDENGKAKKVLDENGNEAYLVKKIPVKAKNPTDKTIIRNSDYMYEFYKNEDKPNVEEEVAAQPDAAKEELKPLIFDLSDPEYNNFINTGNVSEEILNTIADKVKNQEPLLDREKTVFANKTKEINEIIAKQPIENTTQEAQKTITPDDILPRLTIPAQFANDQQAIGEIKALTQMVIDGKELTDVQQKAAEKMGIGKAISELQANKQVQVEAPKVDETKVVEEVKQVSEPIKEEPTQITIGSIVTYADGNDYEVLELTTSRKGTPQAVVKLPNQTKEQTERAAREIVFGRNENRNLYKSPNDPKFIKEQAIPIAQEMSEQIAINNSRTSSISVDLADLKLKSNKDGINEEITNPTPIEEVKPIAEAETNKEGGGDVGGNVMPKEISDLYSEAASLRFTLNALKQQMGGKTLVGKAKAEYENTKTRLDNIELKLSEYEQLKSQDKPKEVKKEKVAEPKQTFDAGEEVNYYDDLFDKTDKVKILYKTGDGENGTERYQVQFENGQEASIWSDKLQSLKETPKVETKTDQNESTNPKGLDENIKPSSEGTSEVVVETKPSEQGETKFSIGDKVNYKGEDGVVIKVYPQDKFDRKQGYQLYRIKTESGERDVDLKTLNKKFPNPKDIKVNTPLLNIKNTREKSYYQGVSFYDGEPVVEVAFIFNDGGKLRQDTKYVPYDKFEERYHPLKNENEFTRVNKALREANKTEVVKLGGLSEDEKLKKDQDKQGIIEKVIGRKLESESPSNPAITSKSTDNGKGNKEAEVIETSKEKDEAGDNASAESVVEDVKLTDKKIENETENEGESSINSEPITASIESKAESESKVEVLESIKQADEAIDNSVKEIPKKKKAIKKVVEKVKEIVGLKRANLKEQKEDFLAQLRRIEGLMWMASDERNDAEKQKVVRQMVVDGSMGSPFYDFNSYRPLLESKGFKLNNDGQVSIVVKDDGEFTFLPQEVIYIISEVEKRFPTSESSSKSHTYPTIKSAPKSMYWDIALSRGLENQKKRVENAQYNINEAKRVLKESIDPSTKKSAEKLIPIFEKDLAEQKEILRYAESIDYEVENNKELKKIAQNIDGASARQILDSLNKHGLEVSEKNAVNSLFLDKINEDYGGLDNAENQLLNRRTKADMDLEPFRYKNGNAGYKNTSTNAKEAELNRLKNKLNDIDRDIEYLKKNKTELEKIEGKVQEQSSTETTTPTSEQKEQGAAVAKILNALYPGVKQTITSPEEVKAILDKLGYANVQEMIYYHGGDLNNSDGNLFLTQNKDVAKEYANNNNGEVHEVNIEKEKIASEQIARDIIISLGLENKEGDTDFEDLMLHELLDNRFDSSLKDKDIEKVKKEVSKLGYDAISYNDEDITGKNKAGVESVLVINKNIKPKIQFLKTPNGEVYGFTYYENGKPVIVIDQTLLNPNTVIHEYGHLFVDYFAGDNNDGVREMSLPNGNKVQVKDLGIEIVDGFYSPLEKTLSEFKGEKLPAKQWIDKFGKSEEAKWTGLTDWLSQQQGSVSKADIQQFLKDNRIQVLEVVLGKDDYRSLPEYKDADSKSMDAALKIQESQNKYWETNSDADFDVLQDAKKELEKWTAVKQSIERRKETQGVTKFSQYQLEGEKENYKEVLVTMPTKEPAKIDNKIESVYKDQYGDWTVKLTDGGKFRITEAANEEQAREIFNRRIDNNTYGKSDFVKNTKVFTSSHFDEPNILVHLRMNTRTDAQGKKVLFLEEVQSDWGQKGKKEGFEVSQSEKIKDIENKIKEAKEKHSKEPSFVKKGEIYTEEIRPLEFALIEAKGQNREQKTPSAPFVTDTNTWTKLALKVALKEAVKQGADKIAWTTGEQQNDRYDLSNSVDDIYTSKYDEEWIDNKYEKRKDIEITLKGGEVKKLVVDEKGKVISGDFVGERLDNIVGKDIAEKILSINDATNLSGDGLKIGGKGMRGFYGSPTEGSLGIVGNVAKSLFKQEPKTVKIKVTEDKFVYDHHNTTVEETTKAYILKDKDGNSLASFSKEVGSNYPPGQVRKQKLLEIARQNPDLREKVTGNSTQHSIDITPELMSSVGSGLPLFQIKGGEKVPVTKQQEKIKREIKTTWDAMSSVVESDYEENGENSYLGKVKANPAYANKSEKEQIKEALVTAIGDEGEKITNDAEKSIFKKAYDKFFELLGKLFGIEGKTPQEIANMKIGELAKNMAVDLLTGKAKMGTSNEIQLSKDKNGNLLAPNGKVSNLNETQWKLVRTKEFKDWFGDWENDPQNASKVVDENGEPLVVYHGSGRDFTEFEKYRIGSKTDYGYFGSGFYFTPIENLSRNYGSITYSTFINAKNPIRVVDRNELYRKYNTRTATAITENLQDEGYDGVIVENPNYIGVKAKFPFVEINAFEPNQIKLADGSNTTFNKESNNIQLASIWEDASIWEPTPEEPEETEYKVRKFAKAAKEAENVKEEVKAVMGKSEYPVKKDAELVQNVSDFLSSNGMDLPGLRQSVALLRNGEHKLTTDEVMLARQTLIVKLSEAGAYIDSADVIIEVAERGTNIGREMRAMGMLKFTDKEGLVVYVHRLFANHAKELGVTSEDINQKVRDLTAEIENLKEQVAQAVLANADKRGRRRDNLSKIKKRRNEYIENIKSILDEKFSLMAVPSESMVRGDKGLMKAITGLIGTFIDEAGMNIADVIQEITQSFGDAIPETIIRDEYRKAKERGLNKKISQILPGQTLIGILKNTVIDDNYIDNLANQFIDEGLSDLEARELANDIKETMANKIASMVGKKKRRVKTELEKGIAEKQKAQLIENLGNLNEEALRELAYNKLDIPILDQAEKEKLEELRLEYIDTEKGTQEEADAFNELSGFILTRTDNFNASKALRSLMYFNMLSGIWTHAKNFISNFMNAIGGVVAHSAATGKVSPFADFLSGMAESGIPKAWAVITKGSDPRKSNTLKIGSMPNTSAYVKYGNVSLGNKIPLFLGESVSRLLRAGDALFYYGHERVHNAYLANIIANEEGLTGDSKRARIKEIVTSNHFDETSAEYAARATFNDKPKGAMGAIYDLIEMNPKWGDGEKRQIAKTIIMPFIKVPFNVLNAKLDWTPIGIARAMRASGNLTTSKNSRAEGDVPFSKDLYRKELLAKGIMGTLAALGFILMNSSEDDDDKFYITGFLSKDRRIKTQLLNQGVKPFSVKIGNTNISYAYTAQAMPLFVAGMVRDLRVHNKNLAEDGTTEGTRAQIGFYVSGVMGDFFQQSSMTQANNLMNTLAESDPGKAMKEVGLLVSKTAATATIGNNAIMSIEKSFKDDRLYDASTMEAAMLRSTPFYVLGRKKLNTLGEEIHLGKGGGVFSIVDEKNSTHQVYELMSKNDYYLTGIDGDLHIKDKKKFKEYSPEEQDQMSIKWGQFIKNKIVEEKESLEGKTKEEFVKKMKSIRKKANNAITN